MALHTHRLGRLLEKSTTLWALCVSTTWKRHNRNNSCGISITGGPHWYPVPQTRHTETVGTMCQDNKGKSGMRQKLSRVCTVGLHLRRHGFVLGFTSRF